MIFFRRVRFCDNRFLVRVFWWRKYWNGRCNFYWRTLNNRVYILLTVGLKDSFESWFGDRWRWFWKSWINYKLLLLVTPYNWRKLLSNSLAGEWSFGWCDNARRIRTIAFIYHSCLWNSRLKVFIDSAQHIIRNHTNWKLFNINVTTCYKY